MNQSNFEKILKISCVIMLVAISGAFLHYSINILNCPLEWEDMEGKRANDAVLFSEFSSPYVHGNDIDHPPVYYILVGLLIKLFGFSMLWGRLVSFLATIISVYLIYKIVHDITKDNFISILSGVLLIAYKGSAYILPLITPDITTVMFSLLGLYFISHIKEKNIYGYLAVISFVLAIYTKQSAVATIVASFVYLYIIEKKLAFKFFPIFLLISISILLYLQLSSDGWFSYLILGTPYLRGNLTPTYTIISQILFLRYNLVFLAVAFIFIFYQDKKNNYLLWKLNFLFSILFTLYLGMYKGIGFDLFIMLQIPATCILFGISFHHLINKMKLDSMVKSLILLLVLCQLIVVFIFKGQYSNNGLFIIPNKDDYNNSNKLISYVKNTEGDILTGKTKSFALLAGKKIWYLSTESLYQIWEIDGKYDPSEIVEKVKDKKFSLIIGYPDIPPIREQVLKNYTVTDSIRYHNKFGLYRNTFYIRQPK